MQDFPDDGGSTGRGYRGICFVDDLCYIASADTLYGYDRNWQLKHCVTHPLFSDLHEIAWDGAAFWVTSTGVDAVFQVSSGGELLDAVWFGELEPELRNELRIAPRTVDHSLDHRTKHHPVREEHVAHPNAIQVVSERPYVTLYYQGAVVAINPVELIWADTSYYGSHSGRVVADRLYLAASFKQSLLTVDRESGTRRLIPVGHSAGDNRSRVRRTLQRTALWLDSRTSLPRSLGGRLPTWLNPQPQRSLPGWTRGLALVDDRLVLMGSSPASVYLIDAVTGVIADHFPLSDNLAHSVFSVEVDPRPGTG